MIKSCGCFTIRYFVKGEICEGEKQLCDNCNSDKLNEWNSHLAELENIIHNTNVPIKIAIQQFHSVSRNSDNYILQNYIFGALKDILLVQTFENKWICSKEKLDFINLALFLTIKHNYIY
uniref:Uncharacterized protein n=1 Tax=viral metagenome TaxID=1070528 RepID=A0A6C0LMJ5_9ZZZZ